jgi:hypothetical protein
VPFFLFRRDPLDVPPQVARCLTSFLVNQSAGVNEQAIAISPRPKGKSGGPRNKKEDSYKGERLPVRHKDGGKQREARYAEDGAHYACWGGPYVGEIAEELADAEPRIGTRAFNANVLLDIALADNRHQHCLTRFLKPSRMAAPVRNYESADRCRISSWVC